MRNVKIVRMITGEDVICNFIEDDYGTHMSEPLEVTVKFGKKGEPAVVLKNWIPLELVVDNITRVNPRNIIAVFDVNETVIEYYSSTMDKINEAIVTSARLKEMEDVNTEEEMMDVMAALLESQKKTLH